MTDETPSSELESTETEARNKKTQDGAVLDILKGAGTIYVGLALKLLIAFLAQRFAAVYLPISGFGSLVSGNAVLSLGGIVGGLGLASGLTRYLPRVDAKSKQSLVKYSFLISLIFSVVLSAATVMFANTVAVQVFNDPQLAVSLRIFGATIPFAVVFQIAIGGIRGEMLPRFRALIQDILQPIIRFGIIILAVVVAAGQAGFAVGYAVPYVIVSIIAVMLLWRILPDDEDNSQDTATMMEMISYSIPFTITGLSSFIYNSIDIFLILYFLDSRAVGIYGVAYALARILAMFSTAFGYLSTPISSQLEKSDNINEAIEVQAIIARWTLIVSLAVAIPMIAFSSGLLGLIYRPAYSIGGSVLVILSVGFVIKNTLQVHKSILAALGKSKILAINTATTAILNIVLNIILIPRYGIEGAAVATSISFFLLGLLPTVQVWHYAQVVSLSRDMFLSAIVSVLIFIIFMPVFAATSDTIPQIMIASGLFAISYITCTFVVIGLNREDMMVIHMLGEKFGISSEFLDYLLHWFQK